MSHRFGGGENKVVEDKEVVALVCCRGGSKNKKLAIADVSKKLKQSIYDNKKKELELMNIEQLTLLVQATGLRSVGRPNKPLLVGFMLLHYELQDMKDKEEEAKTKKG